MLHIKSFISLHLTVWVFRLAGNKQKTNLRHLVTIKSVSKCALFGTENRHMIPGPRTRITKSVFAYTSLVIGEFGFLQDHQVKKLALSFQGIATVSSSLLIGPHTSQKAVTWGSLSDRCIAITMATKMVCRNNV